MCYNILFAKMGSRNWDDILKTLIDDNLLVIKGKVIRKNRLTNLIDRRTFMSEQTNYMGRLIKVASLSVHYPIVIL